MHNVYEKQQLWENYEELEKKHKYMRDFFCMFKSLFNKYKIMSISKVLYIGEAKLYI